MFSAIIDRVQATIDSLIGNVVNRAIIAVPFILAAGFGIAALAFRLVREFGPETGNLILAGVFLVVGVLAAIVFRVTPATETETSDILPDFLNASEEDTGKKTEMSEPDRELLMAAMASATPVALPVLLRFLLRNLPLVLAAIAALFILNRTSTPPAEAEPMAPMAQ